MNFTLIYNSEELEIDKEIKSIHKRAINSKRWQKEYMEQIQA